MSKLREFTVSSARPLPVLLLADVSGSMGSDGKIASLNRAVTEMLTCFAEEDEGRAEIHAAVITFGGENASVHLPLAPASQHTWSELGASGRTPMGDAFRTAREMVEDREQIPSRAYRPTVILVSDGMPTDDWEEPLQDLLVSPRASKAQRFAMAIGDDANRDVLTAFLGDSSARLFDAHEAREIQRFFRWVTMSVTSRTRSVNPDDPACGSVELEDIPY